MGSATRTLVNKIRNHFLKFLFAGHNHCTSVARAVGTRSPFNQRLLKVLAQCSQLISINVLLWCATGLVAKADTASDVIVVGAGSAGLYAAKTLQNLGYEVVVLEATDRIGGRVKSAVLGDMRVELGAEEHYLALGEKPVWPAMRAA